LRMWMVDPEKLCRQHLLGEHKELHMLVGNIRKGNNIGGYVRDGLVQVNKVRERHAELVDEMDDRGYNHESELREFDYAGECGLVDVERSRRDLASRCDECEVEVNGDGE